MALAGQEGPRKNGLEFVWSLFKSNWFLSSIIGTSRASEISYNSNHRAKIPLEISFKLLPPVPRASALAEAADIAAVQLMGPARQSLRSTVTVIKACQWMGRPGVSTVTY